jgi:dTDP-4-dehydrorhamnose reductase
MKVLITGASSYVGAGIYEYLVKTHKFDVVGTYHSNKLFPELEYMDIRNRDDVVRLLSRVKPQVVVHVAAKASISWCENNKDEAVAINDHGTRNIVDACNINNAKVIYISSFEHSNPNNIYGRTKDAGEHYVKESRAGYAILRPGFVIGLSPNTTNDKLFNRILRNIIDKSEAAYDGSWKCYMTWLKHIEEIVEIVISRGITNEIIPVCVPEVKTAYEVANDILSDFNISAYPKHSDNAVQPSVESLDKLHGLGLPSYSYPDIIAGIRKDLHAFFDLKE